MPMVGLCPLEQVPAPANLWEIVPTSVNKRREAGERYGLCVKGTRRDRSDTLHKH